MDIFEITKRQVKHYLIHLIDNDRYCDARRVGRAFEQILRTERPEKMPMTATVGVGRALTKPANDPGDEEVCDSPDY